MANVLIQIGAAEGNDHVTEIIKSELFEKIILVEPNIKNYKLLQQNYKNFNNIIFENVAISTHDGNVNLHVEDTDISHHGSVNYTHLLSHGHHPSNILTFTVESLTFKSLIEKHNLENKQIKYVFMDTEGHDCDIILSTDFSNLDIQNICFEILHADGPFSKGKKLENTIKHLNSFNFQQNLNKNIDYSMWMTRIN